MRYTIDILPKAGRQLKKLTEPGRSKIKEAIDSLAKNPRPAGARNFSTIPKGMRLRVGDYRIVYQVFDPETKVLILTIGDRKDVYDTRI